MRGEGGGLQEGSRRGEVFVIIFVFFYVKMVMEVSRIFHTQFQFI